jgi:hypothetical protein
VLQWKLRNGFGGGGGVLVDSQWSIVDSQWSICGIFSRKTEDFEGWQRRGSGLAVLPRAPVNTAIKRGSGLAVIGSNDIGKVQI